jgi:hypothetical protein
MEYGYVLVTVARPFISIGKSGKWAA